MFKLMPLILENEIQQEEDLGKPHVIGEKGYEFLKSKIEEMNKKATKWGVPTVTLKVIKENFTTKSVFINSQGNVVPGGIEQDSNATETKVTVKQYEIVVIGEPPRVEGYEFVAKIEHTPEGNMLNYAPNASSKNLPTDYRTARQACDVCKTTRDRNNTFILKLEKDDPDRFPEKKIGDFVMVGSGCLKRFLPGISATALMGYAEMIDQIRSSIDEANEMGDFDAGLGSSGQGNWLNSNQVGLWLSAVYLHTGKFMSKKKATEFQTTSTIDQVFSAMTPNRYGREKEDPVRKRMTEDGPFRTKAEELNKEFLEWAKTKDFDATIASNPNYADFFHNLKVLSKQENFKTNNSGFFGALFATFLRDRGDMERKAAQQKAAADFTYIGKIGEKSRVKVRINKIKEYTSQFGQGLIVTMEGSTIEKDAQGQDVEKKGNLLYFTNNFELEEGEEAEIETTVKNHQVNKYTQIPETVITRTKIVNFITHPEKNSGKAKVKDLTGVVKILQVREDMNWNTSQKEYKLNFSYDLAHHPDMRVFGGNWGVGFVYQMPDEATYQSLKQYEGKIVQAGWSLNRAMTLDKLKSGTGHIVTKFTVSKILGDIPPNT